MSDKDSDPMETSGDSVAAESSPQDRAAEYKAEGNKFYVAKNYREAIEKYSMAIETDPSVAAYYGNRAAALLMQGDHVKALKDCNQAVELDPKFTKAWLRRGKALVHLGKLVDAKESLAKVLELEPKNSDARGELGNLEKLDKILGDVEKTMATKSYVRTLQLLGQAVNYASRWDRIKILRGKALLGQKRYNECASEMGFLIRSDNNNADALYLRGTCLYYMGNMDQALGHLRNALQSDPDHALARGQLKIVRGLQRTKEEGNVAFKSGKWQDAVDAYTKALEFDPANNDVNSKLYANRAAATAKLGNLEDAIADCGKAIDLDPQYVKAYLRRGDLHLQAEMFEEAVRDISKAKDLSPDSHDIASKLRHAKLELKKSKRKDYYKILGIGKDASSADIKRGYKKMALKWHPDKNSETEESKEKAEAVFKDVTEAFEVLNDAQKKRKYDAGQDLEEIEHGGGFGGGGFGGGGFGGGDPHDIFNMFFGGGGGGGGFGGAHGFSGFGGEF